MGNLITLLLSILPKIPGIIANSAAAFEELKAWFAKHGDAEINAKMNEIVIDDARRELLAHIEANS